MVAVNSSITGTRGMKNYFRPFGGPRYGNGSGRRHAASGAGRPEPEAETSSPRSASARNDE